MKHKVCLLMMSLSILSSCKNAQVETKSDTDRKIEVYDKELLSIIDSTATIEVLADGFTWSEGPLYLGNKKMLLFTDVPENTIYAWDETNGKAIYLKPSGYNDTLAGGGTEGANGLALDQDGKLILCQHGNRVVARMESSLDKPQANFTYLTKAFYSKKFSSPNDLHICKNGDIIFTDPPYGLPDQDQDKRKELKYNGVYLLKKDGSISLMDSTLTRPNGVALSTDEKYMYVANSDKAKSIWIKYELDSFKNIVDRSQFADVTHLTETQKGLPDGLKINKKGYIFATGPGGVLVFSPDSRHLGTINTGQATANCALDDTETYLYMTAHSYLMRVRLK